jgi:hypothetical protein
MVADSQKEAKRIRTKPQISSTDNTDLRGKRKIRAYGSGTVFLDRLIAGAMTSA